MCDQCDGDGNLLLTSCPMRMIDREVHRAMELAELFWCGLPPVEGGSLDQSSWFVDFCYFARMEQSTLRAELGWMGNDR